MEYRELRQSIKDMEDSKLDSLEIEFPDGTKIKMKKNGTNNRGVGVSHIEAPIVEEMAASIVDNVNTAAAPAVVVTKAEVNTDDCKVVKSPMVGTFYTSSSPDKDAFVKVGTKVKKGDTLCIVEAMKLMNQIESEFDGEVVEICAQNEAMVEYGMPLFKIM